MQSPPDKEECSKLRSQAEAAALQTRQAADEYRRGQGEADETLAGPATRPAPTQSERSTKALRWRRSTR